MSTNLPTPTALLACPYGLDQIRATFGDISNMFLPDHTLALRWQTDFLVHIALPFALPLSWDKSRTVTQMTCHKSMAGLFTDVFGHLQTSGGCFRSVHSAPVPNCRRTRGESQLI